VFARNGDGKKEIAILSVFVLFCVVVRRVIVFML